MSLFTDKYRDLLPRSVDAASHARVQWSHQDHQKLGDLLRTLDAALILLRALCHLSPLIRGKKVRRVVEQVCDVVRADNLEEAAAELVDAIDDLLGKQRKAQESPAESAAP